SSDVFHHGQRQPTASINFVAVHDGFTLADMTSYAAKHNQANGEDNRDGRDGELCANFGIEGPTDDAAINATRERVRRAMLATL
ncbi:glycogen debranching enzyme GlgX, partial [Klebsiella pneumoniae]|nr:glycogen debranching enzyme GlgX [Klebsiella pneumoniae]